MAMPAASITSFLKQYRQTTQDSDRDYSDEKNKFKKEEFKKRKNKG